ncbi:MAG: DUF1064 domain-containing protein, partial [Nanoarchaeota archaeon]
QKIRVTCSTRPFRSKRGWREIGDERIYFRSEWEVRVARHLQFLKEKKQILDWKYEPQTFWFEEIKRGCRSYLPDFKVTENNGDHYWIEVKGYMDSKSKTKLKRFAKYYPQERLKVLEKDWFLKNIF